MSTEASDARITGLPLVPQDAATLVLVDQTGPTPRLLMGRRHPDLAFMANKFVFPGGRVDAGDFTAEGYGDLAQDTTAKLLIEMRGTPSPARARALAIAAVRELTEETGLILGNEANPPLAALRFLARAITPPDRSRRYDTRFFVADACHLSLSTLAGDGELIDLAWFTLHEARSLDIPGITRRILDDIAQMLPFDRSAARPGVPHPIPFYDHHNGQFRRDLV